jgi:hypothetical protein
MACDPEIISFGPSVDVPQIYRIRPYAVVSIKAPKSSCRPTYSWNWNADDDGIESINDGNSKSKTLYILLNMLICSH